MEKLEASTLADVIAAMYPHLGRVFVLEEDGMTQSAVLYSSTGKQKRISFAKVMSAPGNARRLSRKAVAAASKAVPIGTFLFEQNDDVVVFVYTREVRLGYRNRETNLMRVLTSSAASLSMCAGNYERSVEKNAQKQ